MSMQQVVRSKRPSGFLLGGWIESIVIRQTYDDFDMKEVERMFAWMGKYRPLSKDYEYHTESSEAFIYIAMIHIMVRRLD